MWRPGGGGYAEREEDLQRHRRERKVQPRERHKVVWGEGTAVRRNAMSSRRRKTVWSPNLCCRWMCLFTATTPTYTPTMSAPSA
eukprot:981162-Rhodomonas_salina.3